jgi:predicted TPR repeat methyltransferase
MDALSGIAHDRTPDAYLKASFDAFAPKFDHQLVEVLGYRIPEQVRALLANSGLRFARALDLGCGTGLAAPMLKSIGVRQLVGVDVSPGMLDKARDRQLYDGLTESEIGAYLNAGHETFDLIVCLDVVIYFGGVAELFAAIARRTTPGGIFAFSYETTTRDGHVLQPSGRFAHNPHAIERQIGPEFTQVSCNSTVIRLEAGQPVPGQIVLLRRC